MPLTTLVAGTTARAADVNGNFAVCVLTDTARTVTVTHTWTAAQTFTGGWTAAAACTISTGGLTVTAGGLTVTAGGLTVSASGAAITGNSTVTGTLTVTSTINSQTISAAASFTGSVTVATGLTVSAGTTAVQALTATTGTFSDRVFAGASNALGWTGRSLILSPSDGVVTVRNNADDAYAMFQCAGLTATTGTFSGNVDGSGRLQAGAALAIEWAGRNALTSPSDGVVLITNNAATDFSRLQFGGTTAAFPAIARSGAAIAFRVADDSTAADLSCAGLTAGSVNVGGGATVSKWLTATITGFDPGATVGDHERVTTTVAVPGAEVGDLVLVSHDGTGTAPTAGLFDAYVSSADTVTVAYVDQSLDTLGHNPTATNLRVWVIKF